MKFDGFVGNQKVKDDICAVLESGRLPHAIILEGDDGLGKHTLAKIIAKALVCKSDDEKPCGQCNGCSKAEQGYHPDIFDFSPSGEARSFHIDTVRKVISDAYVKPNEADYKVNILCNTHLMGEAAQNAILKILEEPPQHVIFILTCKSKSLMLPTVLSRSVVYSLEGVLPNEAALYISDLYEDISFSDALDAATAFGGNIGKTIESLNNGKLSEIVNIADEICESLVKMDEYELLKSCSKLQKNRQIVIDTMELLKIIFRDALVLNGDNLISGREKAANSIRDNLSDKAIIGLINATDELKKQAQMNANNALLITKVCYELKRASGR